jgi:hypothetical protein
MDLTEELQSLSESDVDRRRRISTKYSLTLGLLGWLIIGFTLNGIIFASFPLRLATVEWQLNLIGSLLSACLSLLAGCALIIIAQLFNTKDKILQKWQLIVSRLAALFAVLLLVIIPLQFYLGSLALKSQSIPAAETIKQLNGIVTGLNAVNSESELRAYVSSLPNSPTLPSKFDAPFPVIKQRAIDNINAQINATTNNFDTQKSKALQTFLKEAVRNTSQAILMATAFSILANLSGSATNAITRFIYSLI